VFHCPPPGSFVMAGVPWGRPDVLFTPAYWAMQVKLDAPLKQGGHRLGGSLKEETVACLAGGHGTPAEVGLAAFRELLAAGVID
jgi:hypothetical protein